MTTKPFVTLRVLWLGLVLCWFSLSLRAEQFGFFTYEVQEGRIEITNYTSGATGPVVIPAEIAGLPVTTIGHAAFRRHTGITGVTIPGSVTTIASEAFHGCTGLTAITIPSSVTSIEAWVFYRCSGLQSISVEPGNPEFTSAGGVLLNATQNKLIQYPPGKAGDYDVPAGATGITHYAFASCTALTSVSIPVSVTSIGWGAFQGCNGLESITVAPGNPHYVSAGDVLFNAAKTQLILYPSQKAGAYAIPATVALIGYYAFSDCTALTGIDIPSSVTTLDVGAFADCTGLTAVTLPAGLSIIYENTFSGCTGLTAISIPASVTSIYSGAFYRCSRLASIDIPAGVTAIPSATFYLCTSLTSVTISPSVTAIGDSAFYGCAGLASITIPASVTAIGDSSFSRCTGLTSLTIPSSVTSIDEYAFSGCTGLNSVVIQPGLAVIDESVFAGCASLASVTIPSTVTSIYTDAFAQCTGLNAITIPSSVTFISDEAFYDCSGLQDITVESGNQQYVSVGGVLFDLSQTELVIYPAGRTGAYSIPDGIASIGYNSFSGCSGLTSIVIPFSVVHLNAGTFYGCTSLQSISVSPGNLKYASDNGVLFNATETTLIQYPPGKAGAYAIPAGVISIDYAFSGCAGLTSVTIPPGITGIGESAFSGCTGLTSATIPSTVSTVHQLAFYGCRGLTGITLPGGITRIDGFAFAGCTGLERAVFLGNAPVMSWQVFENTAPGFSVYFLSSRTGFTSPIWTPSPGDIYPTAMIDETASPAAPWLLEHGLWYDTNLHQDPDGDGVDLLLAYALDIDQRLNQQSRLPVPVRNGNTMSLSFHATSPGITYRAETSADLTTWTTTGVTQSAPGPDGRSTATVSFDNPRRFLRLTVED